MTQTIHHPDPINLVLFGAGRWGSHLLRNFLAHPQINIRAVVEASAQRLASLTHDVGEDVLLLDDWRVAMDLDEIDAVAIATPAATHYTLIETALKKGLHVLAEKPLTLDVSSAQSLCDLAVQQNRQLVIDHTYLFHSAVTTAKASLPVVGQPRYGYATRTHLGPIRRDVDALWDLAIHDISIFNYWLSESPVKVSAQGSGWLQPNVQTPLSPNGLADVVWCRLQYASGFQATIHLCWANPDKQRRLCFVGDKSTLIFDEMNQKSPLVSQQGDLLEKDGWFTPTNLKTAEVEVPAAEPLAVMCDHFVRCVHNNNPSNVSSGQLGTKLVAVLIALSQSMNKDGEWVSVDSE
ncbi:MAG: Gfo/Idh/MocA family oxidoreductase [Cyanobacteria bacterium J06621_11]